MKTIPLTHGKVALVDDDDYDFLAQWKWRFGDKGYAVRSVECEGKNKTMRMHRLVAQTPAGMDTDHKNGNRLDNRRDNLRICTKSQNNANRSITKNTTGYRGVFLEKRGSTQKWKAGIKIKNKGIHLGTFFEIEDAARAYDRAAKEHYGEFAILNFPNA